MSALEIKPRNGYRKRQVLAYVRQHLAATGSPPSYSMIARELHMSERKSVGPVVKRLEAEGKLARVGSGRVRRIRVVS